MAPAPLAPAARTVAPPPGDDPAAVSANNGAPSKDDATGVGANGLVTTNGRAVLLMVVSMALFAGDDALLKLAASLPLGATPGEVIAFHGAFGTLIFGTMMLARRERVTLDLVRDPHVLWRTGGDVVAASAFVTALTMMELGNASAILQVQPLVVTLGAALLLGERVGPRRRVAVAIGLLGVLVIIRPGLAGFTPVSGLVLIGVAGLAARDLATRVVSSRHSTLALTTLVCAAIVPAGFVLHLFLAGTVPFSAVGADALWLLLAAGALGNVGYWCVTQAARVGEVSAIAPFRYSRLVFAVVLGWLVFGERPDAAMIVGSALVVGAGAYALRREAKLSS